MVTQKRAEKMQVLSVGQRYRHCRRHVQRHRRQRSRPPALGLETLRRKPLLLSRQLHPMPLLERGLTTRPLGRPSMVVAEVEEAVVVVRRPRIEQQAHLRQLQRKMQQPD